MQLRWGQRAPDFALPSTEGRDIALVDYRGASEVVLVFYCYDFGNI